MPDVIDRLTDTLSGRYRIERELGAGGMATVFLAEDQKHHRSVALKVLKPELAAVVGAERFLAEIRTTAKLQHPHILPLFDSGEADGFLYYVMPYVDGESLRERLDREKQLPVAEAVTLAGQVADALDYAHEEGVVHRDVKPANVLLSERGDPLVADFGIALALSRAGGGRITETGLSLGTPHYMSPEQATGEGDVDPRSDVYALGCVLYEMLAGQPPFAAPTAQAVLARILTEDARDLRTARRTVPPHVAAVVARALEKLPADRFESAGAFREKLTDPSYRYEPTEGAPREQSTAPAYEAGRRERRRASSVLLLATAGLTGLALGGLAVAALIEPPPAVPGLGGTVRVPVAEMADVGPAMLEHGFDVSPDGSKIVFTRSLAAPLEVVELDGPTHRILPGTEQGTFPVFSADGRSLAFTSNRIPLARVGLDGGAPTVVKDDEVTIPFAWDAERRIYYSTASGAFRMVEGGEPERILDEGFLRARSVRPIRNATVVLFTDQPIGSPTGRVRARDLGTGEVTTLVEDGFDAWYSPTGHLVYGRSDRSIVAAPFDPERLEITGVPRIVLDSILTDATGGMVALALSESGSAVYARGAPTVEEDSARVVFVAEDGAFQTPPVPSGALSGPEVSPDGRTLAYQRQVGIHLFDLVTYRDTPLVPGSDMASIQPEWSPDGASLAFSSYGGDGAGVPGVVGIEPRTKPRRFPRPGSFLVPSSWSADGEELLTVSIALEVGESDWDLVRIDVESGKVTPYLESRHNEANGAVSPNGRWAAYVSDETGRPEIYVRSFPDPGPAVPVAPNAILPTQNEGPRWSPDGGRIYYPGTDSIYAVSVDGSGEVFSAGDLRPLLPLEFGEGRLSPSFTIHPDGRIVATLFPAASGEDAGEDSDAPRSRAYLVVNWLAEVLRRLEGS